MNLFFSLLAGVIFGVGLLVSGMANPAKVIGFLDITRVWDPSLAFVMGGAISVGFFAFRSVKRRTHSLCGGTINLPIGKEDAYGTAHYQQADQHCDHQFDQAKSCNPQFEPHMRASVTSLRVPPPARESSCSAAPSNCGHRTPRI